MTRNIISRVFELFSLALLVAAMVIAIPARAAQSHQKLGGVLLRQNTTEAQVSFSTVDASRLVKLSPKAFRRGVIILDDAGRSLFIRGCAWCASVRSRPTTGSRIGERVDT